MWCNTARVPKLGPLDARTLFPLAAWLLHMREWTLIVSVIGVVVFGTLTWMGYTPSVALRIVRRRLAGPTKWALSPVALRRWGRWF
jgi:intracellular multiplication protein IcmT